MYLTKQSLIPSTVADTCLGDATQMWGNTIETYMWFAWRRSGSHVSPHPSNCTPFLGDEVGCDWWVGLGVLHWCRVVVRRCGWMESGEVSEGRVREWLC